MRKTFAVGAATSGTGCPTRVGRASRSALEITLQRDDSSGKPPRRQTIDYLDQATIDYRDHSQTSDRGVVTKEALCRANPDVHINASGSSRCGISLSLTRLGRFAVTRW